MIHKDEQSAAAKHFTMSNMALLQLVEGETDINRAYDMAAGIVETETESTCDGELKFWSKEVKKSKEGDYFLPSGKR